MNEITLRPFQDRAIDDMRSEFRVGRKRLALYSPTGSGKTEVGIAMIRGARAKGLRSGFLCNRVELVTQASRRFHASGIEHGVLQGDNTHTSWSDVLIGSIQTIARRGYPPFDFLVIDEAHGVPGSTAYRKLLEAYNNIPVVGLTATPFAKGMGKEYPWGRVFDSLVVASTIRELIDDGYLVDCDIYAPSDPDLTGVKIVAGDYHEGQLAEAVDKPPLIGDIVTHWKKFGNGKSTVLFATNIAHSKHCADEFNAQGIPAEHIDCYTPDDELAAILRRVANGVTLVVCNVGVLAEGWDCPRVENMICARPTKSLTRWIQMAGRVLRPYDGKTKATIFDHSGTAKRLGYPTDDLPLELDNGKPATASARKPDKKLPKPCPTCHFLKPVGVHRCPQCGFAPEKQNTVEHIDGELALMTKKSRNVPFVDKQKFYSELLSIKAAKGYSDGWIAHTYRKKFGVWPRGLEDYALEPSFETKNYVRHLQIRYAKSKEKQHAA